MLEVLPPVPVEACDPWNTQVVNTDVWKGATYSDLFLPLRNIPNFLTKEHVNDFIVSFSSSRGTNSSFEVIILEPSICQQKTGNQLLFELRRLTALTWDQIASVVGVSRRSVHHWAAGSKISLKYHQRLGELVSTIRYIDRGFSEKNKDLLMSAASDGGTGLELLKAGQFEELKSAFGKGIDRPAEFTAHDQGALALTGRRSFGEQLSASVELRDVIDEDVVPVIPTGERRAKARRSKS